MVYDALNITAVTSEESVPVRFFGSVIRSVIRRIAVCEPVRHYKIHHIRRRETASLRRAFGTGRYFVGINEQLYRFPTFNQLISYYEPFTFQTSDAMDVRARVGVEYNINPEKTATIFQTYRKGIDDITEINLRQYISDALIKHAAGMDINVLTQGGKTALLDGVLKELRSKLDPVGIRIVKLSWVTDLIYPEQVKESINAKIEATQRALLRENEVAQSKAEAQKRIEEARGIAESTRLRAQAEADAIAIKAKALRDNPDVIQLNAIEKWDGKLPQMVTGDAPLPFISLK